MLLPDGLDETVLDEGQTHASGLTYSISFQLQLFDLSQLEC